MATTGTTAFNLDVNDLIEEAFERCGKELRTGYDFKTARRSLNLLTIEWANRGINLWTVEQGVIPMVTGQAMYPYPADTIDLMDMVIRQNNGTSNQQDINISRIAEPTYMSLPNKLAQGRPIQVYINRQSGQENLSGALLAANVSSTDTTINYEEKLATVLFVVEMGPDCYMDKARFPNGPWCKVGDFVLFRANSGTRINVNGQEMRILNDDSIDAVVPDPSAISRA